MKGSLKLGDVKVGDALPDLDVDLTAAIIVGGAIASRDFTPVHHDRSAAQAAGMSDVFMNILTTNGFLSRFVSDWAGPDAAIADRLIDLDEGTRIVANIVDCPFEDIHIGMKVECSIEELGGIRLPVFRAVG